jgi:hypothetical protein
MRFTIKVSDGQSEWEEPYDKEEVTNPQEWAEETIAWFNTTLRPGERARTLLGVTVQGESTKAENSSVEHDWEKSNLVTIMGRGRSYDTYRCRNCGVTGKRLFLDSPVIIDPKFKAKVYQSCDTAKARLQYQEE